MFFMMILLCLLYLCLIVCLCFFFKQKTSYEMRISDWSSDVCSSDLLVFYCPVRRRSPSRPNPRLPRSANPQPNAAIPSPSRRIMNLQVSNGKNGGESCRERVSHDV